MRMRTGGESLCQVTLDKISSQSKPKTALLSRREGGGGRVREEDVRGREEEGARGRRRCAGGMRRVREGGGREAREGGGGAREEG